MSCADDKTLWNNGLTTSLILKSFSRSQSQNICKYGKETMSEDRLSAEKVITDSAD